MSSTSGGLLQLINATGRIKWFKIQGFIFNIAPLFISYGLFKIGYPSYVIVLLFIIADLLSRGVQLYLLKRMYSFSIKEFVKEAYYKPTLLIIIMTIYMVGYKMVPLPTHFHHIAGIVITIALIVSLCYTIGLQRNEKAKIVQLVKQELLLKR